MKKEAGLNPQALSAAAQQLGWILPQDEAAVTAAERDLGCVESELPEGLRDAEKVLAGSPHGPALRLRLPTAAVNDLAANIARAAREGKAINLEIAAVMRRDRQAAEEARARESNGPDAR